MLLLLDATTIMDTSTCQVVAWGPRGWTEIGRDWLDLDVEVGHEEAPPLDSP